MLTRNGVCYDLAKTPHKLTYEGVLLHFSSELHKQKFIEEVDAHTNKINESLNKRFKVTFDLRLLSIALFYNTVETRGFLMHYGGVEFTCISQVVLDGRISKKQN